MAEVRTRKCWKSTDKRITCNRKPVCRHLWYYV